MVDKVNFKDATNEKKPLVQIRWLLAVLGLILYFLMDKVKNSLSVAIIGMVNSTNFEKEESNEGDRCFRVENDTVEDTSNYEGEYSWSNFQQAQVLSAYTWGSIAMTIFGGRLGELYGQRLVVAVGLTATGLLDSVSPLAASAGPDALFLVRFTIGCCNVPMMSAFQSILSRWAPRQHLATMMSVALTGISVGSIVGVVVDGYTAENWGWRWVFWCEGFLILAFVPLWLFFVRNDPEEHPHVSSYEKNILEENKFVSMKSAAPWKEILRSPNLYVCILAQFARSWVEGVQNAGPIYMNQRLGLKLNTTGWVNGTTGAIGVPCLLLYGWMSDFIIHCNYVSRLFTRRIMHFIGAGAISLLFVGLALSGCNVTLVITFWVLTGACLPATFSSLNVSIIDFAPNYAGTVMGLIGIGNIGAALSPIVSSILVKKENGWSIVFLTCAAFNLSSCFFYSIFISDQPASWNFSTSNNTCNDLKSSGKHVVLTITLEEEHKADMDYFSSYI